MTGSGRGDRPDRRRPTATKTIAPRRRRTGLRRCHREPASMTVSTSVATTAAEPAPAAKGISPSGADPPARRRPTRAEPSRPSGADLSEPTHPSRPTRRRPARADSPEPSDPASTCPSRLTRAVRPRADLPGLTHHPKQRRPAGAEPSRPNGAELPARRRAARAAPSRPIRAEPSRPSGTDLPGPSRPSGAVSSGRSQPARANPPEPTRPSGAVRPNGTELPARRRPRPPGADQPGSRKRIHSRSRDPGDAVTPVVTLSAGTDKTGPSGVHHHRLRGDRPCVQAVELRQDVPEVAGFRLCGYAQQVAVEQAFH
jgi:hypothetical protein